MKKITNLVMFACEDNLTIYFLLLENNIICFISTFVLMYYILNVHLSFDLHFFVNFYHSFYNLWLLRYTSICIFIFIKY